MLSIAPCPDYSRGMEVQSPSRYHSTMTDAALNFYKYTNIESDDNVKRNRNDSYNSCHLDMNLHFDCLQTESLLPTVERGSVNDLPCVTSSTVANILSDNLLNDMNLILVDCRYPYEYDGGHIKGAENIYLIDDAIHRLFDDSQNATCSGSLIIFHCEFSTERAPRMYRLIRQYDRKIHEYPSLRYPHMFILDKGYKDFFNNYKEYCDPDGYTSMFDGQYKSEKRMFRVKCKTWPQSRKRRNVAPSMRIALEFDKQL